MAPISPITFRDNTPHSCTAYQVAVAMTGSMLLVSLCAFLYTYHRFRSTLANSSMLSQLSYRLRGTIEERDGHIGDLEAQISEYESRLGKVFTIGDGDDSDEEEEEDVACSRVSLHDAQSVPVSGALEPRVARMVTPRLTIIKPRGGRNSTMAVVDGPAGNKGPSSGPGVFKEV
ncbi:hypothetical protein ACO1O0_007255 [Amphichorda felina]